MGELPIGVPVDVSIPTPIECDSRPEATGKSTVDQCQKLSARAIKQNASPSQPSPISASQLQRRGSICCGATCSVMSNKSPRVWPMNTPPTTTAVKQPSPIKSPAAMRPLWVGAVRCAPGLDSIAMAWINPVLAYIAPGFQGWNRPSQPNINQSQPAELSPHQPVPSTSKEKSNDQAWSMPSNVIGPKTTWRKRKFRSSRWHSTKTR